MLTCPFYVYPFIPHFYIAKLGFTGIYIHFFRNFAVLKHTDVLVNNEIFVYYSV